MAFNRIKSLLWLVMLLLFPAIIADQVMEGYLRSLQDLSLSEQLEIARLNTARIKREMHLPGVVEKELSKFADRVENIPTRMGKIDKKDLQSLEKDFFAIFPRRASLMWFDENCKIVNSGLGRRIRNRTAWEKFVLAVAEPEKASAIDLKIANGFIKTEMSNFLTVTFFKDFCRIPVEILYRTERMLLRLVKIEGRVGGLKYFMVALPIARAYPYWLERRALVFAHRLGFNAGAFKISEQFVIPGSNVGENLLHGFSEEYRRGSQFKIWQGKLYYFSHQQDNPDLFICLVLPLDFRSNFLRLASFLRLVFFLPFFCGLIIFFKMRSSAILETLSLRTRFKLATIGLTVAPILLMTFTGMVFLVRLSSEVEHKQLDRLENGIGSFSDSITMQKNELERFLRNDLGASLLKEADWQSMAESALNKLQDSGCHLAMIITRDGRIFSSSTLEESQQKTRISFFVGMIKMPLLNENFDVEKLELQTRSALTKEYSDYRDSKFRYEFHNRLNAIEIGPTVACLFSTFIRNEKNDVVAAVGLGFYDETMKQFFLKKSLRLNRDSPIKVFLQPRSVTGTYFRSSSPVVDEVLRLSALTGDSFDKRFKFNGEDYLIRSKILDNADSAAAAVMKIKTGENDMHLVFLVVFALIFILAAINSNLIFRLFERIFLRPVFDLSAAVKRIRDGNYDIALSIGSRDELGSLNESFNKMAVGLREKSEMKGYLNEDLYSGSAETEQANFLKITATVMFCGIRKFSQFEAKSGAEDAFEVMNRFLAICEESTRNNHGRIDKFIGDTAMASFKGENQQSAAINAAIEIKRKLQKEFEYDSDQVVFGVGIACGELISGQIGSMTNRLDYTVIGDPVNLAARLEKLAGRVGRSQIFVSEELASNSGFSFSRHDLITVKGKEKPVQICEIFEGTA